MLMYYALAFADGVICEYDEFTDNTNNMCNRKDNGFMKRYQSIGTMAIVLLKRVSHCGRVVG